MPDLRALRKQLGLTQDELAAALGVSRKTVCEREAGKVPITRETELAMQALMIILYGAEVGTRLISASDLGLGVQDRPSRP